MDGLIMAPAPKWQNATQTPTYWSWKDMRSRCYNPKNKHYANYGERGIKVCDRWLNSYDNFVEDMGFRQSWETIERLDSNGDYHFDNCVWAARSVQNRNARSNRYLEHGGNRMLLTDWAIHLGISISTLHERLTKDYTQDQIFHMGPLTLARMG